jgi:hypothetical protein
MILELLLGSWVLNSVAKDIDNCIDAYNEDQDEMQEQINYLQEEVQRLKSQK